MDEFNCILAAHPEMMEDYEEVDLEFQQGFMIGEEELWLSTVERLDVRLNKSLLSVEMIGDSTGTQKEIEA